MEDLGIPVISPLGLSWSLVLYLFLVGIFETRNLLSPLFSTFWNLIFGWLYRSVEEVRLDNSPSLMPMEPQAVEAKCPSSPSVEEVRLDDSQSSTPMEPPAMEARCSGSPSGPNSPPMGPNSLLSSEAPLRSDLPLGPDSQLTSNALLRSDSLLASDFPLTSNSPFEFEAPLACCI